MPSGSSLYIVGTGPGCRELRTAAAEEAIRSSEFVVGYGPYLELIHDLLPGKEVVSSGMGGEVERARTAIDLLQSGSVALVSSGDPNVYGMAGLALELAPSPSQVRVVPGVTAFTAAACRAGIAFRRGVAVVSLSDLLTSWQRIEARLRAAASIGMPVALYNPRSSKRSWQLQRALEILGDRDVLIARNISRGGEELLWSATRSLIDGDALLERVDMNSLVIVSGEGLFCGRASGEAYVNIVGIGPGCRGHLTHEALEILQRSERVYGARRYLKQTEGLSPGKPVMHEGSCHERMAASLRDAASMAAEGRTTSILTGGDPSIFSSWWRSMAEEHMKVPVHICPGVSAFSSVAARAGAPLVNDFALLCRAEDEGSVRDLSCAGFGVVVYNVGGHEIQAILEEVDPERPCALGRDVARDDERMVVMRADDLSEARQIGLRYTLIIASENSYIKDGMIITKRGYDSKYCYQG